MACEAVKYIAGGMIQNSIGDDDFGKELQEACMTDGVHAMHFENRSAPTGKCAVAVLDRSGPW